MEAIAAGIFIFLFFAGIALFIVALAFVVVFIFDAESIAETWRSTRECKFDCAYCSGRKEK